MIHHWLLFVIVWLVIVVSTLLTALLTALHAGRALDRVAAVGLFLLYSIPSFWLATMLILYDVT